jgi:tetratricopeptide (TPR) repeat protein
VAYERFTEARAAQQPEAELLKHLNDAVGYYQQALDLLPPNAVDDLAVTHNQLGNIYYDAGDLDRALPHYRESIRHEEALAATLRGGYDALQPSRRAHAGRSSAGCAGVCGMPPGGLLRRTRRMTTDIQDTRGWDWEDRASDERMA